MRCLLQATKENPVRLVWMTSLEYKKAKALDMQELNWSKRTYKAEQAFREASVAQVLFGQELAKRYSFGGV